MIVDEKRYDDIIREVLEMKTRTTSKPCHEYRRIRRYGVISVDGVQELIEPINGSQKTETRFFVHNQQVFEILAKAHSETGHEGVHRMHNNLKTHYPNITREVIQLYLSCCNTCVEKNPILKEAQL
ncbi:hypothetical protein QAD02_021674 [Eretmocerus hayati]|uniref:Uncharacterized protein n=1 Tax=Eretmocerus hayati TaxID=131215 RepID=A0ACC2PQU7_9HYME|nr:hypothetical protein QAD02_021674 [Eretmocerus hayati]